MSRLHSRLARLEAACRPQQPDPSLEVRFRRACARLIVVLELALQESDGPVYRGSDPYTALKSAERRLHGCE
jgi:hypothetical protein